MSTDDQQTTSVILDDSASNSTGGVPLLIDDQQDANVTQNINNNINNNGGSPKLSKSQSSNHLTGSDEFANEQMYNSLEQNLAAQQQGNNNNNSRSAGRNNNNNQQQQQRHNYHHGHHHQFVPNNHPSVSPFETNLFVAGLPPGTDDEKLGSYFTKFGKIVSARVLVDLVTHTLRNYGFVKFETRSSAEQAIEEMNEYRVTPNQVLHVTWATHREDAPECDTLYVRNLPDNVTRQELNNYFTQYGEVRELSLPRCAPFRGVCFVRYRAVEDAKKALDGTHNATPFGNRALQVRYKAPSKGGNNNNGMMMNESNIPQQQQQQQQRGGAGGGMQYITNNSQQNPMLVQQQQSGGGMMPIQQQQQQFVQVIGPNGQIQLVPHSAISNSPGNSLSMSANSSTSSHPMAQQHTNHQGQPIVFNNNNSHHHQHHHHHHSHSTSPHISPGSSMEGAFHHQQQHVLQTLPNGQQVLVMAGGNNNNNNNSAPIAPPPPPMMPSTSSPFPTQGDLCFFNVTDDNELVRYLTQSFGQVSVSRRTPEGALLIRLFNTQQHDFCVKHLNGKALAQGQNPMTVGMVGVQK